VFSPAPSLVTSSKARFDGLVDEADPRQGFPEFAPLKSPKQRKRVGK